MDQTNIEDVIAACGTVAFVFTVVGMVVGWWLRGLEYRR